MCRLRPLVRTQNFQLGRTDTSAAASTKNLSRLKHSQPRRRLIEPRARERHQANLFVTVSVLFASHNVGILLQ